MAIHISETLDDGSVSVIDDDLEDWARFAQDNATEIVERYGSQEKAYRHTCDGGLVLGGGASPEVVVCFKP